MISILVAYYVHNFLHIMLTHIYIYIYIYIYICVCVLFVVSSVFFLSVIIKYFKNSLHSVPPPPCNLRLAGEQGLVVLRRQRFLKHNKSRQSIQNGLPWIDMIPQFVRTELCPPGTFLNKSRLFFGKCWINRSKNYLKIT